MLNISSIQLNKKQIFCIICAAQLNELERKRVPNHSFTFIQLSITSKPKCQLLVKLGGVNI